MLGPIEIMPGTAGDSATAIPHPLMAYLARPYHTPAMSLLPTPLLRMATAIGLATIAAWLISCETDVAAVRGTDLAFSVYGVLSPQLDTQWVKVFPVETTLGAEPGDSLDILVRSVDRTAGTTVRWHQQRHPEPLGASSFLFLNPGAVPYGHVFRIEVIRSGRVAAAVETAVPPLCIPIVRPPELRQASRTTFVDLPVRIDAAPQINFMAVTYHVEVLGGAPFVWTIPYPTGERLTEDEAGWTLRIDLTQDRRTVEAMAATAYEATITPPGMRLESVEASFVVASDDWLPRGGAFDRESVSQPGVLQNVQEGFGFVGAGYEVDLRWTPPDSVLGAAGFRTTPW